MQRRRAQSEETRNALQQLFDRVVSMLLVQQLLHPSRNFVYIDTAYYIPRLIQHLLASYKTRLAFVTPQLDIPSYRMHPRTASYCGLVITELVSNSLRHGFCKDEARKQNTLTVTLRKLAARSYVLTHRDNGVGFPPQFVPFASTHLGLQVVRVTVEKDLSGTIRMLSKGRAEYEITFLDEEAFLAQSN
jgi:two-component sensor histidine kinase